MDSVEGGRSTVSFDEGETDSSLEDSITNGRRQGLYKAEGMHVPPRVGRRSRQIDGEEISGNHDGIPE